MSYARATGSTLQRTLSTPVCKRHPALNDWPSKNLVLGICPACGSITGSGLKAARVLHARWLARAIGS